MNKYKILFHGRQVGAIGITYNITEDYEANSLGEFLWKLWTDYEMIRIIRVSENNRKVSDEELKNTELIKCDYEGKKWERK